MKSLARVLYEATLIASQGTQGRVREAPCLGASESHQEGHTNSLPLVLYETHQMTLCIRAS